MNPDIQQVMSRDQTATRHSESFQNDSEAAVTLNQFEPIGTSLNLFGPFWTILDQLEPVGTSLNQLIPVGTSLDHFGPVGTRSGTCLNQQEPVETQSEPKSSFVC